MLAANRSLLALAWLAMAACSPTNSNDDEVADETAGESSGDSETGESSGEVGETSESSEGETNPDTGTDTATSTETGDGDGDGHLSAEHCPGTPGHPPGTGLFVGGGGVDGRVTSTLEGESWADVTTTSQGPQFEGHSRNLIRGLGYGGGVFVAVGGLDNCYVVTSCDGVNWRHDVLATNVEGDLDPTLAQFLSDVAYLDGVFVAAGGAGALLRSDDHGLTWTRVDPDYYAGHLRGIAAEAGRFVATGHAWEGDVGVSIVSTDGGLTWSSMFEHPGTLGRVVAGNGVFVATGAQRCAVSSDGETWDACGFAVTGDLAGPLFVDGEFLVQTLAGEFFRSPDGSAWTGPTQGWLPDTITHAGERFVMARWMQRGWASAIEGPWTTLDMGGLSEVVWGEVLWSP
ncbi:WD40/YVTN/BNR-like repeat-containing protein [Nannocystaceae bacterium ST9]